MSQLEDRIAELIQAEGPLTGAEIQKLTKGDSLAIWQACRASTRLDLRTLGQRYLRLDRKVEGYARLSPSILREFMTYSVTGLAGDPRSLDQRVRELAANIERISQAKYDLANEFIQGIRSQIGGAWPEDQVCIILAGDIVYRMAHEVPRPERSTGKLVRGSDIDLVVVLADEVPDAVAKQIDDAIYKSKYRALITPSIREEIDYVVKTMARVHEQVRFDTFKRMVACKILNEGVLLHGNRSMFDGIKLLLRDQGVMQKLEDLERQARVSREMGLEYLLHCGAGKMRSEERVLFYSAEESEEFE